MKKSTKLSKKTAAKVKKLNRTSVKCSTSGWKIGSENALSILRKILRISRSTRVMVSGGENKSFSCRQTFLRINSIQIS